MAEKRRSLPKTMMGKRRFLDRGKAINLYWNQWGLSAVPTAEP